MRANLAALLLSLSSIAVTQPACTDKQSAGTSTEQPKHIVLPIAYDFGSSGVMLFINEANGVVAYGNRQPPNWFISGPPSQDHLIACEAKPLRCVEGLTGFKPIIDGNLTAAEQKRLPRLGLQVKRKMEKESPCRTLEIRSIEPELNWSQTVVSCAGIGVAQVVYSEGGKEQRRLDLKSAEGLFASGLLFTATQP
jgi:hypothetical protein